MNLHKTKFIELLKDPTVTKLNGDLDELESLVETYPYFQSGRILLAKEKYAHNALDVKKYIVDAAIHTTDRRLLKKYIEQKVQIINEGSTFIVAEEPIEALSESPKNTPITEDFHTDIDQTPSPTLPDIESPITEIEETIDISNSEERIESNNDSITADTKSEEDEKADVLDASIDGERSDSKTSLEDSPTLPQESIEENASQVILDQEKGSVASEDDQSEEDRLIKEKIAKYRSALGSPPLDTPADPIIPSKEDISLPLPETDTVDETSVEEDPLEKEERIKAEEILEEENITDPTTSPSQPIDVASIPTETEAPLEIIPTSDLINVDPAPDPDVPTAPLDHLISEVRQDMIDLRASKLRFQAMMKKLDEEKENKEKENKEKTLEQISQPEANKIISPPKKKTSKKKVSNLKTKKVSASSKEKSKEKSKKAVVKETKKSRPKQQDQKIIIDEFIENNPKIKPVKPTDAKKPSEDLSAKSTEFKPEESSEYLARIYIEQNKKKKAIAIYESLSLKFPEKKSYFAGLIKKLKTK